MKAVRLLGLSLLLVAATMSAYCFADGYTYIDSNAGGINITLDNTDNPADGPPVSTFIKDAQKLFPSWVTEKNLPQPKAYYVKSYSTRRVRAASWQPIDHIEGNLIAVTKAVDSSGNYYLYNCEVHYDRPIGSNKWTVRKDESNMTLGDGKPKTNGIHLISAGNVDLTLQQSTKEQQAANDEATRKADLAAQEDEKNRMEAKRQMQEERRRKDALPPPDDGTSVNLKDTMKKFIPW